MKTEIQIYNEFMTDRFGNIKYKDYDKPMFRDRIMKTLDFQRYLLGYRFRELGNAILKALGIEYFTLYIVKKGKELRKRRKK